MCFTCPSALHALRQISGWRAKASHAATIACTNSRDQHLTSPAQPEPNACLTVLKLTLPAVLNTKHQALLSCAAGSRDTTLLVWEGVVGYKAARGRLRAPPPELPLRRAPQHTLCAAHALLCMWVLLYVWGCRWTCSVPEFEHGA